MADTYSTNLGLIEQEQGAHDNTWGTLLNLNLDRLDVSNRGVLVIALSGDKTLSSSDIVSTSSLAKTEASYAFIEFTGTAGVVTVPAKNMMWIVRNSTSSGTLTITPSGGTGVTVASGKTAMLVYGLSGTTMLDVANEHTHDYSSVYEPIISPKNTAFNKNFGTGATDVAAGDHTHAGVYEPADATILKDADIGINVAAQSHTHTDKADKTVPSAANNVALLDASGNLVDSGSPLPSAPGAEVKAWIKYNGVTQTLIASYNVASVTYHSAGDYTVNFTAPLPAHYTLSGAATGGDWDVSIQGDGSNLTTTSARIASYDGGTRTPSNATILLVMFIG